MITVAVILMIVAGVILIHLLNAQHDGRIAAFPLQRSPAKIRTAGPPEPTADRAH